MNSRRALFIAACLLPYASGPAAAQFQPPPQPQQQAPGPSPWSQPQPQKEPPCVEQFGKLRDDAQKKAQAIRTASEHKVPPKEACALFNSFFAAETKLIKYAAENATWCGIPQEVIGNLKLSHSKTESIRTQVCRAAAAGPPRPAGPSLSDALGGGAVPDANNIRTGRGTYDTLTGTPLGPK